LLLKVILSKKLYSSLHSIEVEFYSKKEKFAFWATLWET